MFLLSCSSKQRFQVCKWEVKVKSDLILPRAKLANEWPNSPTLQQVNNGYRLSFLDNETASYVTGMLDHPLSFKPFQFNEK